MATYQFGGSYQAVRPGVLQVRYVHFTVTAAGTVSFGVANQGSGANVTQSQFYLFNAAADGGMAGLVAQGLGTPGSPLQVTLTPGTYILAFSEAELTETEARNGENADDDAPPFQYNVTITTGTATIGSAAEAYVGTDQADYVSNTSHPAMWGHGGDDGLQGTVGVRQRLVGGAGNDILRDSDGQDTLEGGTGNDVYVVYTEGTKIVEHAGEGRDEIVTSIALFSLADLPDVEDLVGLEDNPFTGQTVFGQTLIGNDSDNLIIGRSYNDSLFGGAGNDTLNGQNGDDTIFGGDGNDTVVASAGNDTIDGGADSDSISGGEGNDRLITSGPGNDSGSGGTGTDTLVVDYSAATNSIVTRDSLNGINPPSRNTTLGGYDGRYTDEAGFSASFSSIERFEITTGSGGDFIWTAGGADQVTTGAGNDTLITFGGNDILDGGTGDDLMRGGTGDDVYHVDTVGDTVEELDGEGTDEVRTALGSRTDFNSIYVLPAFVENLTGTATTGQGVSGNALNNLIRTGDGADLVVLQEGGDDAAETRGGNDFIFYGAAFTSADRTDGGEGFDTVGLLGNYTLWLDGDDLVGIEKLALYSSGGAGTNSYTLATADATVAAGTTLLVAAVSLAARETLVFDGSAETNGRFEILSGAGADTIAGGAKNDFISGGGGDDAVFGLAGNDTLRGGLGADMLRGGTGRDTFRYEATAESNAAATDRIVDFQAGGVDRIDLSAIDAKSGTPNNDAFTFVGTNTAFSGTAGELRIASSEGGWFVEGDVDGDGVADLVIRIGNGASIVFAQGDFVL